MFKNFKGITLIALVVTIIVLLILAGVSIATLTGDNGILTRAQDAKTQTEEAEDIEKIRLAITEAQIGNTGYQELTTDNLGSALIKDGTKAIVYDNEDGTKHILFLDKKKEYKLDNNENIENLNIDFDTKYAAPSSQDEERNSEVIGIGTDGKAVDMDLWEYCFDKITNGYALNDAEVLQNVEYNPDGTNTDTISNPGYIKDLDDGKIVGSIPQYISIDNGKTYTPVTSLYRTFSNMKDLLESPIIPSTVINMLGTFSHSGIIKATSIPSSVKSLTWTFEYSNLTKMPYISEGVTNMMGCFFNCANLTEVTTIPKTVTCIENTFLNCKYLKLDNFVISENIDNVINTFYGCTNLTGTLIFNANPTKYGSCFQDVASQSSESLIVIGNADIIQKIVDVSYGANIIIK